MLGGDSFVGWGGRTLFIYPETIMANLPALRFSQRNILARSSVTSKCVSQKSPIFVDDIPRQTGGVRSQSRGRGSAGTTSDGSLRRGTRMIEGRGDVIAAEVAATATAPAPRIEPPGGTRRRRIRRHGSRRRLAVRSGARAPLATPAHAPHPPPIPPFPRGPTDVVVDVVLLQMQVNLLNDELPLLVLLTILVGLRVRPSDEGATALAGYVRDGVQACDEDSVLGGAGGDVDALVEEVRPSWVCFFWGGWGGGGCVRKNEYGGRLRIPSEGRAGRDRERGAGDDGDIPEPRGRRAPAWEGVDFPTEKATHRDVRESSWI